VILDLSLCQYTHLYEPGRIDFNCLFKLLTLFERPILDFLCKKTNSSPILQTQLPPLGESREANAPNWPTVLQKLESSRNLVVRLDRKAYFCKCENSNNAKSRQSLRQIFNLKGKYRSEAAKLLGKRPAQSVLVAVHIRRGDYRVFKDGRWFFSDAVYLRSMENLARTHPAQYSVAFLLIGDEQINPENFASVDVLYFGASSVGIDQALLEASDAILGPVSTFSAWPSFLHRIPRAVISSASQIVNWEDFRTTNVNADL
jgi:hypothetical protein